MFSSNFPSNLGAADIWPTYEKKDKSDIEKHRLISILPTLFKIYEKYMYDQMYKHFDQICSKCQCDFGQTKNKQHCLLVMVEKWKEVLYYGSWGDALRKDLSNVFDCIKHDPLITKLCMYGFDCHPLSFIFSYHFFTIYWKKTKNKNTQFMLPLRWYSMWSSISELHMLYQRRGIRKYIFLLFVFF